MGLRRIIVLLIALVAAGGSAMYARSWIEGQQATIQAVAAPAPKEEIHEVLVADADLPAGSFVKPQHLRWQRWPTDDVPESYVLKGVRSDDEMIGAVVRRRIAIGEPLTDGAVVKPGERGFLAAVLEPGMRAVSVPVTPTSANSGLIFPGDRVDLILTQSLVESESEGSIRRVSETVLSDIRIIAMGTDTSDDPEEGKANEKAKTATLEVTPGAGREGRPVDRARQAVAEPAQPRRADARVRGAARKRRQSDMGSRRVARPAQRAPVVAPPGAARQ